MAKRHWKRTLHLKQRSHLIALKSYCIYQSFDQVCKVDYDQIVKAGQDGFAKSDLPMIMITKFIEFVIFQEFVFIVHITWKSYPSL